MADFMTPKQRSRAMSKVRGKETEIERTVRSCLHRKGFRFHKNVKHMPGKPDIVLPKYRAVVFIHGCFWHHHSGCAKSKLPETRKEFWKNKIQGNINRDKKNIERLLNSAWRVAIIWECALKRKELVLD
ncbi:MAG: DNA mismatch endonuclease Vsr, partial [Calditrichaeota bacterium]